MNVRHLPMYRALLSVALLVSAVLSAAPARAQSSGDDSDRWQKQILDCLNPRNGASACPLRVYELEANDPADQFSIGGGRDFAMPLWKGSFLRRYAGEGAAGSGSPLTCQMVTSGAQIGCAYSPSAKSSEGLLGDLVDARGYTFVHLLPPYRRHIEEPVRLTGQKYLHQGFSYDLVDDFWKDWVKYDELTQSDRLAVSRLMNFVLKGKTACIGGRNCKRYDLIISPDGLGVFGQCEHAVIDGILSPPRQGSCKAEIAFTGNETWVLATVKAVPGSVGVCMRCPLCCMFDMVEGADFFTKQERKARFRERYRSFITEAAIQLKSGFESPPWNFKAVYYQEQTNEFQGVSGRRRSDIIDGFEDLYLSVRPIVRFANEDNFTDFSVVEEAFRKLSQDQGFLSRALGPKNDVGLDVSIHLEIYVSKYNTAEDTYWIKTSSEQEQRYKDALARLFSAAVEQACNKLGFRWEVQATLQQSCVETTAR